MLEGKENELGNFSKLLRKLEMDNVSIPELRLLKQEHAYLQKLRQQRLKIEELKCKYDESEGRSASFKEQIKHHLKVIEDLNKRIELLEDSLQDSQRRRSQLEHTISKQIDNERERQKSKIAQMAFEMEELRKELKQKDILIYNLEDEVQRKVSVSKDQFAMERRKLVSEYDEKIRSILQEGSSKQQQNSELKALVTRQHKALQLQSEQYDEVVEKNESLAGEFEQLQESSSGWEKEREELEERINELVEINNRLSYELSEKRNNLEAKDQLDEIRKKVSELTKGEIEKIQFIVNQFD